MVSRCRLGRGHAQTCNARVAKTPTPTPSIVSRDERWILFVTEGPDQDLDTEPAPSFTTHVILNTCLPPSTSVFLSLKWD